MLANLLFLVGVVAISGVGFTLLRRQDERAIRAAFTTADGEISQVKLVGITDGGGARLFHTRTYRVVLSLSNGGRLLRRAKVRGFGAGGVETTL